MKPIFPIAAATTLALAAAAAPVLSHQSKATDAEVCVAADTKSSWASGNASSRIAQANRTVADQQAYCAGLKAAAGTNAAAATATDNRGAVGHYSGTTDTRTPDAADTDEAAGMTTTANQPAQPAQ